MKLKRIVAMALSALMAFCLLSGGGNIAAAQLTGETPEPYTVTWYQRGNGMTPDHQEVMDEVARLCADMNITLNMVYYQWGEYSDKLNTLINSSEKFDLFSANSDIYNRYVPLGAMLDITDLFYEDMPNYAAILPETFVNGTKIGGRMYGIPTYKETFQHWGLDINMRVAQEAGVKPEDIPTQLGSLKEIEPFLRQVKENLPDIVPLFARTESNLDTGNWDYIARTYGSPGVIKLDDPTLTVINEFETPEMMDLFRTMHGWYNDGLINENPATVVDNAIWSQGLAFCRTGNLGPIPEWELPNKDVIRRITIGNKYTSTNTVLGAMVCVSSTSADPKRAMEFYDRFCTDTELYNTVTFGIEGKHYVITDDTTNPWKWSYPEGKDGSTVGYLSSGAWALGGNWFMSYIAASEPANRNELVEEANKQAIVSPALGFSFAPSAVQNQISACATVWKEYADGLYSGQLDPDIYVQEYIDKLKQNGVDEIIAEKQRQIDAWAGK